MIRTNWIRVLKTWRSMVFQTQGLRKVLSHLMIIYISVTKLEFILQLPRNSILDLKRDFKQQVILSWLIQKSKRAQLRLLKRGIRDLSTESNKVPSWNKRKINLQRSRKWTLKLVWEIQFTSLKLSSRCNNQKALNMPWVSSISLPLRKEN